MSIIGDFEENGNHPTKSSNLINGFELFFLD